MKIVKTILRSFLFFLVFTLAFAVLLFPFNDLSQLVSDQVGKATQNRVYLQFKTLSLSLFPIGIQLGNVNVETQTGMQLKVDELVMRPSVMSALSKKPFGFVEATGLLDGSVRVSLGSGSKSEKGAERYKLDLKLDGIKLNELKNLANLPLAMEGKLSTDLTAQADPEFKDQPESEFNLAIQNFKIPNSNLSLDPSGFMSFSVPELKIGKLEGKGRLENANLVIDSLQMSSGSDISGNIKGQVQLTIENFKDDFQKRQIIAPRFGAYNFDIKINVTPDFEKRASIILVFISKYKTQTPGQYHFKVSGDRFGLPPKFTALQ